MSKTPPKKRATVAKKRGGPSIRVIAERLNISKSTVALAVSSSKEDCPLAPATRERILKACDEMGYRVNSIARTMRTGRFNTVAMILGKNSPYFLPAEQVYGADDALESQGYRLNLTWLDKQHLSAPGNVPKVLEEWSCDGLLIHYPGSLPSKMFNLIERHQIPTVWMNSKLPCDCVHPNDFQAAHDATERLIALGHKRIGYLHLYQFDHYSEVDRFKGYERAMKKAKLSPLRVRVPSSEPITEIKLDKRHELMRQILQRNNRPTAFICYETAEVAAPLLVAALSMGLRVPEDFSLIAFGRYNRNSTGITISTIQLNLEEVGRRSVEMLLKKIENPAKQFPPVALSLKVDNEATLAPPPKG
ncbi:LacI family DNA-binding transcriptional regulator [Cerasicoccus frondis]|uniref:LacI family DNA-binding transcriptional regulator n=1 Tax=Cerasicoccus frondis TaxID=490090 RepID=UPI002852AECF|nr:LacI family DNA-binding transcriptional regulator [Cerasicoccus frondis]